jgi:phytoene desaturase
MKKVVVLGAGFAGLSAACHLAKGGVQVTVVERHEGPGGRARRWDTEGFRFDMGPSWYWMPDVFERFFRQFGREVDELYSLKRIDPSYRIVWPEGDAWDLPAGLESLRTFFEAQSPGAGASFDGFIAETRHIYETAMAGPLFRPSLSLTEYADPRLLAEVWRLRLLRPMSSYARSFFPDPRLARLVEWPVLFLGAPAERTSALYSLMSYADLALGTWWPMGGMFRIVEGMHDLATELGVTFRFGERGEEILVADGVGGPGAGQGRGGRRGSNRHVTGLRTDAGVIAADAVLASADYHHVEQTLLKNPKDRQYAPRYWAGRTMSPSSLLFYLGVEGELGELPHHALFFDRDLDAHMDAVYGKARWPEAPLFYVSNPSVTDPSLAPAGHSNVFILVPLAPGLSDSDQERDRIFHQVMDRLEAHVGQTVRDRVRVHRSFAMRDFETEYGAFQGNAYGMANTLSQTGPFRPKLRSTKVQGLYFAGQLTVPGPGMPPSLISGELAAQVLLRDRGETTPYEEE